MYEIDPKTELVANGIHGLTGKYGVAPMTRDQLRTVIARQARPNNLADLIRRVWSGEETIDFWRVTDYARELARRVLDGQKTLGVPAGVDPKRLDQTGWGLILPSDDAKEIEEIKEALKPLLDLRQKQAGALFKVYDGEAGHRLGQDASRWLAAAPRRMGPGSIPVPSRCPYYLLICGDPGRIDYRFQFELDAQYAVGRIHFDKPEDYENYAKSVVRAETGMDAPTRKLSFFGTGHPLDIPTQNTLHHLIKPLHEQFSRQRVQDFPGWEIDAIRLGENAKKARLMELLGGAATPSLLFAASHGMEFPLGDRHQRSRQGALICQDWPFGQPPVAEADTYLAGEHLTDVDLHGMIAFLFACYGGGTPRMNAFWRADESQPGPITKSAFVADLPRRLLSMPGGGGALAVISHVDRAWTYSFQLGDREQTEVFRSTLHQLLTGHPVGSAMEYLNSRYAALAVVLTKMQESIENGTATEDPDQLVRLWTAVNDAGGYGLIGDPAVRLPGAAGSST